MAKEYKILTNITMDEVNDDTESMFDELGQALHDEQMEKLSDLGYEYDDLLVIFFRSNKDNLEIESIDNAIQRLDLKNGCDLVQWSDGNIGFKGYGNDVTNTRNGFEILRKKDYLDELAWDWVGFDLREEKEDVQKYAVRLMKEEIDNHGSEEEYTEHFDGIYKNYFQKQYPNKVDFIQFFLGEFGFNKKAKTWKEVVDIFEKDDYCYDGFHGNKYRITGEDTFGLNLENIEDCGPDDREREFNLTSDPREALRRWFQLGRKYPTCVEILAKTREDAITLLKEATPEYITELYTQYGNWMKLEYIIKAVEDGIGNNCRSFYETEYGDSVHPFSCG